MPNEEEKKVKSNGSTNSGVLPGGNYIEQAPEGGSGVLVPQADSRDDLSYQPAPTPEHKVEAGGNGFQSPEQMPALSEEEIEKQKKIPKNGWPEWWSGKRNVDGVETTITFDEIKRKYPNITASDYINAVGKFRGEVGLPVLDWRDWIVMRGNNAPDKTYKQQKRDAWRHFLVDAIQPVSDVLKAAVAYGYGKAGRTYIPIDRGDGSARAMSDRMRRLEEVRAAQNWDAWADTFRNKERERLQQEAEARRAAVREQERQQRIEDDFNGHVRKREYDAAHRYKTPDEEVYEEFRSQGMSPSEAVARRYGLTHGGNRVGGSGGGRGAGGGRGKSPAYPYYVGDKPYSQEHFNDAVLHALSLEYPREDMKALSKRLAGMTPEAKTRIFKKHGRIVK